VGHRRLESAWREASLEVLQLDRTHAGLSAGVPAHQPALARPATRVRVASRRTGCPARAGPRSARTRVDHYDRAYDNQKLENLQTAALKLESGKTFDPSVGNETNDRVDDRGKFSSFFQVQAKVPTVDDQEIDPETEPNSDDANNLGSWLGSRDSNPDNVVQRTSDGLRSAPARVTGRSSRSQSRRFRSVSLCSCAACLIVSQPARPVTEVALNPMRFFTLGVRITF
jgi:hypothetical protein